MVAALSPWPLAAINIGRAEILLLMVLAGCRLAKAGGPALHRTYSPILAMLKTQ
jgi:hypothetical protein